MNIFLPYENNVKKSVENLDCLRLQKQLVEVYQLLTSAIKEKNGEVIKGHSNHPVYLFYKDNPKFLAYYGYECCREYYYRTKKWHSLTKYFNDIMDYYRMFEYDSDEGYIISMEIPKFTPYYMEGSLGQPNYIRTTENVSKLFQNKLCKKWDADKEKNRPPKWGNRPIPEFYRKHCEDNNEN